MNKYSKRFIGYRFLVMSFSIIPLMFIYLMLCVSSEENETYTGFLGIDSPEKLLLGLVILFISWELFSLIFNILYWHKLSYSINDKEVMIQKGIIFKSKKVVSYEKMHAITVEQNLIMRIFGISKLNIDSGNTEAAYINEIEIVDKKAKVVELEQEIKNRKNAKTSAKTVEIETIEVKEDNKQIQNDCSEKESYQYLKGLLDKKTNHAFVVCSLPFFLMMFIFLVIAIITMVLFALDSAFTLGVLFVAIFIYFVVVFLVYVISRIAFYLKYYKYEIAYNDKEIVVSYGFFATHKHIIARNRIKGLIFSQDIIQEKKRYGQLIVELVGLCQSAEQGVDTYFIPFQKIEKLEEIVSLLGFKYNYKKIENNVASKSYVHFISIPYIAIAIIALPLIIGFITSYVAIIILAVVAVLYLIIAILSIFSKKHQGITSDDTALYFSTGVLIKKSYIIPWTSIVSIGTMSTPIRMKKGIVTIVIDYYTKKLSAVCNVQMVSKETYRDILYAFESKK